MIEVSRSYDDETVIQFLAERRGLDVGQDGKTWVEASQINPHPRGPFTVEVRVSYELTPHEADEMLQRALLLPE